MNTVKIGLLPLYLKLYDDKSPAARPRHDAFCATIAAELERRGLEVLRAPVCRVRAEFEAAVAGFERGGAQAIVTLHLAYSPSLESSDALARTPLPLVVLDTTPTWSYGPGQNPDELMYNHGIHGVQDMCNLLVRSGKAFHIEAGHWQKSDVLDRTARAAVAASAAARLRAGRVGLVGEPFPGMGDFHVPPERLAASVGPHTVRLTAERLRALLGAVTDAELAREREADAARFDLAGVDEAVHLRTLKLDLALERWVDQEGLTAFTFNFMNANRSDGFETVPFLAASKLMGRGIGYAGEGDLLTASLVGAVASIHPDTSFTEMFCPDWENGTVYLSHMGEINWRLIAGRPRLAEMKYIYSDAANPAFVPGRFRAGGIVLADLAPLGGDRYRFILVPAEMLDVPGTDNMERSVRGWFRPAPPLPDFLAAYSRLGGTHHLALSYADSTRDLETFGRAMGWETVVVAGE